ncbi:MAG: leucine-rich repeat protein [Clostridia bacterium]|nr:leucine-rich repeat protein [Clostridia bacterium]
MKNNSSTSKFRALAVIIVIIAVLALGSVAFVEIMKRSDIPTVDLPEETVTDAALDTQKSPTTTGQCGEKAYYVYDESGNTLTITGSGAIWDAGDVEDVDFWGEIGSKVKILKISSGITEVGAYSLQSLDRVEEIYISETVQALSGQVGGTAVSWSDYLVKIVVDANNKNYFSDEKGVLYNKDKTEIIQYPIGSEEASYEVLDTVKKVGSAAFAVCVNLKAVSLPESVEEIEQDAFMSCSDELVIRCVENSAAHEFAVANKIKIELV